MIGNNELITAVSTDNGHAAPPDHSQTHPFQLVDPPTDPDARSFCQKFPSLATSKPIMSFTAIMGALTDALPVTMTRTSGALFASRSRLASLMANPRRWPRCSGATTVSIWKA